MNCNYNPFTNLTLLPSESLGDVLQWSVDPVADNAPFCFTVELSGDPAFNEIISSHDVGDTFVYYNKERVPQTFNPSIYYRVKMTDSEGNEFFSRPINITHSAPSREQYQLMKEIMRKEVVRLKLVGKKGYLLKLKSYTQEADDETVDPVTGLSRVSEVRNLGTEKAGGYYDPLGMMFSIEHIQDEDRLSAEGNGNVANRHVSLRTIGIPPVSNRDVIVVYDTNDRYLIKDVQRTYHPGTTVPIIQTITAVLLPYTDILYQRPTPKEFAYLNG